jgi:hypothetical protein
MEVQDRLPRRYAEVSVIAVARALEHDMTNTKNDLPLLADEPATALPYGTLAQCIAADMVRVRSNGSIGFPQLELTGHGPIEAVTASLDQAVIDGLAVKTVERTTYYTQHQTELTETASYAASPDGCAALAVALYEQLSLFAQDVLEHVWNISNPGGWPAWSFPGPKMLKEATGMPMGDVSKAYRELVKLGLFVKTDSNFSYNGYDTTALLRSMPEPTTVAV